MASAVRETPRINASSEPSAATAAPTVTTGTSPAGPPARTASANGAADTASRPGAQHAQHGERHSGIDHQRDPERQGDRRGIVRAGSRTSSPSVAIRA